MDKTHEAVLYWVRQEGGTMPEISLFCGIRITMFYSDHTHRISMRNMVAIKHWWIFSTPVLSVVHCPAAS